MGAYRQRQTVVAFHCHPQRGQVPGAGACGRRGRNRGPSYNFYGAPCHIIVSYKRDEMHAFLDGSAAIQTMLLAAQSLGLSTCWINQLRPLTDDPAIRPLLTQLGVPEDYIVIGSIALGYAAKETAPAPRKEGIINIIE